MVALDICFINTLEAINRPVNPVRVKVLGKSRMKTGKANKMGLEVKEPHSRQGMTALWNVKPGVCLFSPGSNLGRKKCLPSF